MVARPSELAARAHQTPVEGSATPERSVRLGALVLVSLLAATACGPSGAAVEITDDAGGSDGSPTATEALQLPSNLRHIGYFQAYRSAEVRATGDHTTLSLVEELTEENLALARQNNQRVFAYLTPIFFNWDQSLWRLAPPADAQARWNAALPLVRKYADIIQAFVAIDEPEFASFVPVMSEPNPCRDGLESIARTVRASVPGAKFAVNFWYTTVNTMASSPTKFARYYPPSFDYVGTESYNSSFDSALYNRLASLTARVRTPAPAIFLVPKAFLSDRFPQAGGEAELISKHLSPAFTYAGSNPRVFAIVPFMWRSFVEAGSPMPGANELPSVKAWLAERGRALKSGATPTPTPTPAPSSPYPMSRAESNDTLSGWVPGNTIDGNVSSAYSSNVFPSAANSRGTYIAAWTSAGGVAVSTVRLTARRSGTVVLAFPRKYNVYLTAPDNSSWVHVGSFTRQPSSGVVALDVRSAGVARKTYGVLISPTELGTDDHGNFYFQLAELGLLP